MKNMPVTPLELLFEGKPIRTVSVNGRIGWVGKDLTDLLLYKNSTSAINRHCKGIAEYYPLFTVGGMQEVRILFEADVLRLIIGSTLPVAVRFEKWVFEEVLPAIRETGHYELPNQTLGPFPQLSDQSTLRKEYAALAARKGGINDLPLIERIVEGYCERWLRRGHALKRVVENGKTYYDTKPIRDLLN